MPPQQRPAADRQTPPGHTLESTSFTARQTELAWSIPMPYDAVWDAVVAAIGLEDLRLISADRKMGLAVAGLPFSPLTAGRRLAVAVSRRDEDTLVRATLLHGLMSLQGKSSRMRMLDDVLRTALRLLEREVELAALKEREEREKRRRMAEAARGATQAGAAPEAASAPDAEQGAEPGTQKDAAQPSAPPAAPAPPRAARSEPAPVALDYSQVPWEELPLERPSGENFRPVRARPSGGGLSGVRRSLLWFLIGTLVAVGAVFLLDALVSLAP